MNNYSKKVNDNEKMKNSNESFAVCNGMQIMKGKEITEIKVNGKEAEYNKIADALKSISVGENLCYEGGRIVNGRRISGMTNGKTKKQLARDRGLIIEVSEEQLKKLLKEENVIGNEIGE